MLSSNLSNYSNNRSKRRVVQAYSIDTDREVSNSYNLIILEKVSVRSKQIVERVREGLTLRVKILERRSVINRSRIQTSSYKSGFRKVRVVPALPTVVLGVGAKAYILVGGAHERRRQLAQAKKATRTVRQSRPNPLGLTNRLLKGIL